MTTEPHGSQDGDWLSSLPKVLWDSVNAEELRGPVLLDDHEARPSNGPNPTRWEKFLSGGYSANLFNGID